ncbi:MULTISPECIES: effector-associated constant component EACC1 [unclassified Streptomyces]|uniref:effector-associated constant component EACC1 n=1 Tax=unclassified Streptomyces TaxID=2593676 RepID=UPI002DD8422C|nr:MULTISPECIES: hypothetical protein [unclassified Streptomyces]WSA92647.1 hypothetical protein OIE63_14550 [Streptomyces sp. NBC_01795]WSB77013.1 hypothetical protein OHB04_15355 [Streptomyces sp. NBC_01775]WSS14716.1 hypothetical protein OG533_24595 [Streptomyces sp. NBC_01186]WSS43544.1 hypothetical protein OG220_25340 [Streptomyces sp. NBC_01187]
MEIGIRTGGAPDGGDGPPGAAGPDAPCGRARPADPYSPAGTSGPYSPADDADRLASLHRWLLEDDGLPRGTSVTLRPAHSPGAMGGAWEAVNIVLTHATALANLALAVATWRRTHAEPPAVRIESRGVTVSLDAGQDHDAETVRRLLGALAPPQE